ncbi:MAG TPA: NUDIX domain-containing protein [Candidatus Saccharimonadales bacterium]|jgi:isopentenyldiphosphate isomerase
MELFDLVDKDDIVIGTTDKPTAHAQGLLHRVAAVYVFNENGELYVQVHKGSGGLLDHSVGGHVSKGEDYATAASREAMEELGLTQPLQFLSTFYSDEGAYQHMFGLYECVADQDWSFAPSEEVAEIIPMKLSELLEMMEKSPEKFTGGFINTMRAFRKIKHL